jgi:hypothetical protein
MLERKCAMKKTRTSVQSQLAPSSLHTPTHMSLKTTEFLTDNMVIIPHPPYSLDVAPCDFALFPKLKIKLKG